MRNRYLCFFWIAAFGLIAGACGFLEDEINNTIPDFGPVPIGPGGVIFDGQMLGESCSDSDPCRDGLTCEAGTCEAPGDLGEGSVCAITQECADGLVCDSLSATCQPTEGGEEGAACSSSTDCAAGLRCDLVGFSGICRPDNGDTDVGGACEADTDCYSPLLCAQNVCQLPAFGGALPMEGAQCPRGQTDDGPFRALFEVPRDEPLSEFFALPFPNDVRLTDSGIDMSGFYNPGTEVLGGEFFDAFISNAGADLTGFSPSATVYLRFSKPFDTSEVSGRGDNPTLFYRNITDGSDRYNNSPQGWSWKVTTGRGNFLCYNSVQVRASWSHPRNEGETYAVWITTDVGENPENENAASSVEQDEDFAALLSDQQPSDSALADAWQDYAPFRAYLDREGIDPATIATAAVFTVGTPSQAVQPLRAAVEQETEFSLDDLTLCDGSNTSPCADGADRGCLNQETGYIEIHGTYEAPVFQQGTRPYLEASDGGTINVNNSGLAETNGTEEICMSMAIPADTAMPEGGWPVIMYAHGTGGSFTSHLQQSVAGALTNASAGGNSANFVTIGIDGVMHGPRRGDSTLSPDILFFNPMNPQASRANVLQGAADYFYLTRLLQNVSIGAGDSPTGSEISFNPDALYFYGHSQGATVGTPFAAAETGIEAAVLSGAGGSLVLSLLNKKSPQDIASLIPIVLGENDVDERHPFLNLVQQWIDPADALNYGGLIPAQSNEDTMGRDVLQTFGVGDTYTPPAAMKALGGAADYVQMEPVLDDNNAMPDVSAPVSGNRNGTTAVMVQYEPSGYDGHFVAFRNQDAIEDITQFFITNLLNGTATVD